VITKKPNLFVVGAPRAGTTRLYELFNAHPAICVCERKEPYYYSHAARTGRLAAVVDPVTEWDHYLSLFECSETAQFLAETSTTYCWDPITPEAIKRDSPDARIIFVLRDPVQRFFSHFMLHREKYGETRALIELINASMTPSADSFDKHIVESGFYAANIKRYLSVFDASQILVLRFEQMQSDVEGTLMAIQTFLELATPMNEEVHQTTYNSLHARKSKSVGRLHNWRNKIYPRPIPLPRWLKNTYQKQILTPSISTKEKKAILDMYHHDQMALKEMIGWNYLGT
jgi:hypothetical protein